MRESGLNEILPLICTLAIWSQYLDTSWISSGLTTGSGCSLMAASWQVLLSALSFRCSRWRAAIIDDCVILCLLIWQEIFHFSVVTECSLSFHSFNSRFGCLIAYVNDLFLTAKYFNVLQRHVTACDVL